MVDYDGRLSSAYAAGRRLAENPRTLREHFERLSHRALSTFEHLPEAELDPGFECFRAAS